MERSSVVRSIRPCVSPHSLVQVHLEFTLHTHTHTHTVTDQEFASVLYTGVGGRGGAQLDDKAIVRILIITYIVQSRINITRDNLRV